MLKHPPRAILFFIFYFLFCNFFYTHGSAMEPVLVPRFILILVFKYNAQIFLFADTDLVNQHLRM